jgi:hypothetical protein
VHLISQSDVEREVLALLLPRLDEESHFGTLLILRRLQSSVHVAGFCLRG